MERSTWWTTAVSDIEPGSIRYRGYPVEEVIDGASFASTIWLLLRGELPSPAQARLLERALVAGADHGPQAPSIAIARMAMTCGVGVNNAMASAINVLGDVHGGAGEQLMEILAGLADADDLPSAVADVRRRLRYVPGFGHRFHPRDPRRDPLVGAVTRAVADGVVAGRHLEVALEIERQLSEGRERAVPMNIDGATAIIYAELGFAPALGRGLFVLSRAVGALAHAWEESGSGARNKGPVPRDQLAAYAGPPPRHLEPRGD
ncbi:citryl-CoA lyase [Pseudonocardia sichuanensis]|uniref:citrate synthase (unknown stereospecificity) n=1 Tax=Pseudonocardia kunmingensis TaxID=630975 RepID=A0A543DRC1_9PSEU|nr:citryl-CoA lyase [Pseudonocardia kunmingensis]TQM11863.1 citrate synthase [Pseudonocardia kunmingensis]